MRGLWLNFTGTLKEIVFDPTTNSVLLGACLLYSFFYLLPYDREYVQHVPIAIVDADHSHMSRELSRAITSLPDVSVEYRVGTRAEAIRLMEQNVIHGIVEIPRDFQSDVLSMKGAVVLVRSDGGYLMRHRAILQSVTLAVNELKSDVMRQLTARGAGTAGVAAIKVSEVKPPVVMIDDMFNDTGGYASYVVPTVMLLVVQIAQLVGLASLMGARWERRKLYPGGERRGSFWGTLIGQWLVVWLSILYVTGLGLWKSNLPSGGPPWQMIAMATLYANAIVPLAVVLGLLIRSRIAAFHVILIASIPTLFLSGFAFPREMMPTLLWYLGEIIPSTQAINGFMKLSQMQSGWAAAHTEMLALAIQGLVYMGFAWMMWRWTERRLGKEETVSGNETTQANLLPE